MSNIRRFGQWIWTKKSVGRDTGCRCNGSDMPPVVPDTEEVAVMLEEDKDEAKEDG